MRFWRARGVEIGEEVRFTAGPIITRAPSSRITLGNRVHLISSPRAAVLGIAHRTILRTKAAGAIIELGDDVGVTGGAIVAAHRVTIGYGSMLGANVLITDTDFHPIDSADRRYAPRPESVPKDAVRIGRNVFIGTGCIVLKGVSIGDNSVVGAGSVVSSSIPANSIAAGVPARVLRAIPFD